MSLREGTEGPRGLRGGGTHSQVAGDGGVAGHGFWGQVVVAVGAVEEGLAALAVGEGALQDQPRARTGLGVQRGPAGGAILQVKAARGEATSLARGGWSGDLSPRVWGRSPGMPPGLLGTTVPLSPARPSSVALAVTPAAVFTPALRTGTTQGTQMPSAPCQCTGRWDWGHRLLLPVPSPPCPQHHHHQLPQALESPKVSTNPSSGRCVPREGPVPATAQSQGTSKDRNHRGSQALDLRDTGGSLGTPQPEPPGSRAGPHRDRHGHPMGTGLVTLWSLGWPHLLPPHPILLHWPQGHGKGCTQGRCEGHQAPVPSCSCHHRGDGNKSPQSTG